MKLLTLLTLVTCISTASAAEYMGGIGLDSSVPADQVSVLKQDLSYLYQNPVIVNDEEFLTSAKLKAGTGDHLHNFILNRVKYIVGEEYDLEKNVKLRIKLTFDYPNTPLPDGIGSDSINEVRTVMSNIGGAIYLTGKASKNFLLGLKVDDDTIVVKSPRDGILQVGEGLFFNDFLINKNDVKAASNSISRLGTLFHEARHSDGNGKSTGFLHAKCPKGHPYEGHAACEVSGNGPYSIGALSERHLTKNCSSCSTEEKTILSARIADSFNRIISKSKVDERATLEAEIKNLKSILEFYQTFDWPEEYRNKANTEIKSLQEKIAILEAKLANTQITPDSKPELLDDTPEGKFNEISLKDSIKLMNASLKK